MGSSRDAFSSPPPGAQKPKNAPEIVLLSYYFVMKYNLSFPQSDLRPALQSVFSVFLCSVILYLFLYTILYAILLYALFN